MANRSTGRAWLCLVLFLCVFCSSNSAGQNSGESLDSALKQKFVHKRFMLRGFYSDKQLHFDSTGNPVRPFHVGSWATSLIEVEKIHVASTHIELKGSRWAHVFDKESKFRSVRTSQELHIVVDRQSSTTDAAVIGLIEGLFVNQNENMAGLVPDYWRAYFSGRLQLVPQEDGHNCRRIEGRVLRNPDGSLWFPCEEHAKTTANLPAPSDVTSLPYHCTKGILCPKALFTPDPEYEELARAVGFQGVMVLDLTVNADGNTGDIQILQPLGFGLDDKAVEVVRQWKFKPANMDGHPVPAGINVEVEFRVH